MNLSEYKSLCSNITNEIAREIKSRYPKLDVEVVQDDYYSMIKIGDLFLNIDYPTLDYDDIYKNGSTKIYLTKEISTPVEKPRPDRGVVRMPTMNRVKTKKVSVNYNGDISDSLSLVNYLSKVKMFKDEVSSMKESTSRRNSLSKRKSFESSANRKLTLEQRVARLERALKTNAALQRRRKFESFESDLDEAGARAAANRIAQQFGRMIGAAVSPDDLGTAVIDSPRYGWLSVDDTDEIESDQYARFAFQYKVGDRFSAIVFPTENSVELMTDGGYSVDPDGNEFEGEGWFDDAYTLSDWEGFDLSMIHDEDD